MEEQEEISPVVRLDEGGCVDGTVSIASHNSRNKPDSGGVPERPLLAVLTALVPLLL